MKRVALITGTSTGLGISLSIKLASMDFVVYATMRDTNKRSELLAAAEKANVSINILPLDVQSNESVNRAVARIIDSHGQIDVLINNAGAGCVRTTEHASEDEVKWVMDVNFHGVVRCTKAVLPHMRSAGQGKVINISSVGGLVGQPFSDIYCAAKFAVEGYTESLASYITPNFGIQFCCIEPGGISTEFANNVVAQLQSNGPLPDDEYKAVFEKFLASGAGSERGNLYQTADEVADVVINVVKEDTMPLRRRTSEWAETFCSLKTQADPDGLKQVALVKRTFG
ncbi:short-chain dehydrogenase/reductase [Alteromonas sp. KUL17]|uniref:SDR family oxidoreductase n=1 Tax=Alteromonas sp. KUL17 TaxID=2480796 RepID=UPI0010377095|nr:SDR family oxidoreductase [Alteromonas sp. KUL17]TAP30571.1 SDR family oxidoreductase [Alteromonas sp. KUL17]GEA01561.1 short-chain dehydrogenase/reductase [Alteromonas sp. KUL17]